MFRKKNLGCQFNENSGSKKNEARLRGFEPPTSGSGDQHQMYDLIGSPVLAAPERTQTYLIRQLSFPNLSTISRPAYSRRGIVDSRVFEFSRSLAPRMLRWYG